MQRVLNVRLVIAVVLVAVAMGTFVLLTPTTDAFGGLCTYYSNGSYTTVVGQRGQDCCGNPVSWGQITPFRRCETVYCIWCPPPTE